MRIRPSVISALSLVTISRNFSRFGTAYLVERPARRRNVPRMAALAIQPLASASMDGWISLKLHGWQRSTHPSCSSGFSLWEFLPFFEKALGTRVDITGSVGPLLKQDLYPAKRVEGNSMVCESTNELNDSLRIRPRGDPQR
jgi:hypothetical protein